MLYQLSYGGRHSLSGRFRSDLLNGPASMAIGAPDLTAADLVLQASQAATFASKDGDIGSLARHVVELEEADVVEAAV